MTEPSEIGSTTSRWASVGDVARFGLQLPLQNHPPQLSQSLRLQLTGGLLLSLPFRFGAALGSCVVLATTVVVGEFVEVESGRKADRPQLAAAMEQARKLSAVVAVAKLDRLARDAELVLRLAREAERNGFGGLLFADLPDVDATTAAGRMVLTVMASVAEFEARRIGERTREALAAAKARGVKLGGIRPNTITRNDAAKERATAEAETLRCLLTPMVAAGYSLRRMSQALAAAGKTTRNGSPLSASTVALQLQRLGLAAT